MLIFFLAFVIRLKATSPCSAQAGCLPYLPLLPDKLLHHLVPQVPTSPSNPFQKVKKHNSALSLTEKYAPLLTRNHMVSYLDTPRHALPLLPPQHRWRAPPAPLTARPRAAERWPPLCPAPRGKHRCRHASACLSPGLQSHAAGAPTAAPSAGGDRPRAKPNPNSMGQKGKAPATVPAAPRLGAQSPSRTQSAIPTAGKRFSEEVVGFGDSCGNGSQGWEPETLQPAPHGSPKSTREGPDKPPVTWGLLAACPPTAPALT